MRLAMYRYMNEVHAGVVQGESLLPLHALGDYPDTILELICRGPQVLASLAAAVSSQQGSPQALPLSAITLLTPIPNPPNNVICLGLNYASHVNESAPVLDRALVAATEPVVFTKARRSLNDPHGDIPYDPVVSEEIDWEVELAVIIGKEGRCIPRAQAMEYVFGYAVLNDISARDIQARHKQFFLGKSLDGTCPVGPWIVTKDEIPDPQQLGLRTRVNGVLKQDGSTASQIHPVAKTIEAISRYMTLQPGDIIATGTPDGVGSVRKPPEFLRPGDVVEAEVDGIGTIRNRVVLAKCGAA